MLSYRIDHLMFYCTVNSVSENITFCSHLSSISVIIPIFISVLKYTSLSQGSLKLHRDDWEEI